MLNVLYKTRYNPWLSYLFAVAFGVVAYFSSSGTDADGFACFAFPFVSIAYLFTLRRFFREPSRLHVYGHMAAFVLAVCAGVFIHMQDHRVALQIAVVYSIVVLMVVTSGAILLLIFRSIRRKVESIAGEIENAINAFVAKPPETD